MTSMTYERQVRTIGYFFQHLVQVITCPMHSAFISCSEYGVLMTRP